VNGPEHYREAERLLQSADEENFDSPEERGLLAAAQVHATLALAAATTLPTIVRQMGDRQEVTEWARLTAPRVAVMADRTAASDDEDRKAVNDVLTGHPTWGHDENGERDTSRECKCSGCEIARRTRLRTFTDVRTERAPGLSTEPPF
jgi:hypothetical protein